jgi:mannitol/fructose-specific phosphotransferase system IIA component
MSKEEALEACVDIMNEQGYISEDGILDICDRDNELVWYCEVQLTKLIYRGDFI